jgi:DNA polymerase III, delta subunit
MPGEVMSFTPATDLPSSVIGHERTRLALEQELPPQPVLLLGPESTGKWVMAMWLAAYHAPWYNQRIIATPRIAAIREVRGFLATPPSPARTGSGFKVMVINLNNGVSLSIQDALLKDLEESPGYARFILVASRPPLATISSRCIIWRWGRLTDDEVARVLVVQGVSERDAVAIAPIGLGRVEPALKAVERFRPARSAVLAAVRAITAKDSDQFERAVRVWGDTEDWMLRELLGAAASGNSTPLFSTTERQLIGSTAARRGIALLAASGRARPQVAVRALAATLMQGGST